MGFYIDQLPNGVFLKPKYKWDKLMQLPDVDVLDGPPATHVIGDKVAVCIIDNGPFDAAGIAFSEAELYDFVEGARDTPCEWLMIPIATVTKLNPYVSIQVGEV